MKVVIEKLTGVDLMREACEFTMLKGKSKQTLKSMYKMKHSPQRTQIFIVKMYDIPAFVAHHFRTHNVGFMGHFITSRRDDRGGEAEETRSEPVNHMFICNAESLMDMSHDRMCHGAVHIRTWEVMNEIKKQIETVDPDLYPHLKPKCMVYRDGCTERNSCGLVNIYGGESNE